jgi:hypothetical protein
MTRHALFAAASSRAPHRSSTRPRELGCAFGGERWSWHLVDCRARVSIAIFARSLQAEINRVVSKPTRRWHRRSLPSLVRCRGRQRHDCNEDLFVEIVRLGTSRPVPISQKSGDRPHHPWIRLALGDLRHRCGAQVGTGAPIGASRECPSSRPIAELPGQPVGPAPSLWAKVPLPAEFPHPARSESPPSKSKWPGRRTKSRKRSNSSVFPNSKRRYSYRIKCVPGSQ